MGTHIAVLFFCLLLKRQPKRPIKRQRTTLLSVVQLSWPAPPTVSTLQSNTPTHSPAPTRRNGRRLRGPDASPTRPPCPPLLLRLSAPDARAPLPPQPPPLLDHGLRRQAGRGPLDPCARRRRQRRHRRRLHLPLRRRPLRRRGPRGLVHDPGAVPQDPRTLCRGGAQAGVHGHRLAARRGAPVRVRRQNRAGDHRGAALHPPRRGCCRARRRHGGRVRPRQDKSARRRADRAHVRDGDGDQVILIPRFSTQYTSVLLIFIITSHKSFNLRTVASNLSTVLISACPMSRCNCACL